MVKQIIKEAMEKNPLNLKEEVQKELMERLRLRIEAKKEEMENDDYEDDLEEEDYEDEDEDDLEESISASKLISHMKKVDYDEWAPSDKESKEMMRSKPVATYSDGDSYAHLHDFGTYSVIHHSASKNPKEHDMYDGYHKISGSVSPEEFKKAMKSMPAN